MKITYFCRLTTLSMFLSFCTGNTDRSQTAILSYAGEEPPGIVPRVFAKNIVSSKNVSEFSCTFSADGKEFYFARKVEKNKFNIFVTKDTGSGWSEPELALFSGDYFNHEPYTLHGTGKKFTGDRKGHYLLAKKNILCGWQKGILPAGENHTL